MAVEAVLPWTCVSCGGVQGGPGLCPTCWTRMPWISAPVCMCCGAPFDVGPGLAEHRLRCAGCAGDPPVLAALRAALRYDTASRRLVLGFKHADRLQDAPVFASWLVRAGADLLPRATIVAPVPLHWTRLAWRRYNQAAILARLVARHGALPYAADLLVRSRRTASQGVLTRDGRRRNVAGAFAVHRRWRARVTGQRVLLIDDVSTTGATLAACARVLLAEGAAAVDALTIARVADPLGAHQDSGSPNAADLSSSTP